MQKEIKYIGFYENPFGKSKRNQALSATNKMDYIASALHDAGLDVHMISPSWMLNDKNQPNFERKKTNFILPWKKLTSVSSWKTRTKFGLYLKIAWSLIWLFLYLLFNVKKNEKVLVYHSPWLALPILFAKKIKHFQLILEVEEIYSDVSSLHPYFDKLEQKIFKVADSFLFSTDLLSEKIKTSKNYIVIYGNYHIAEDLATANLDGKIHLIYAGIIDSHKAGAFNAIESALFLNDNYVIHIIGFGETELLRKRIDILNKTATCKIVFNGLLSGDEYIKYCQRCHIGLSTQKMDGAYLESSFPSKILSYLGMGLNVVSCKIECVQKSKIRNEVIFYNDDTPKSLAEAILKIDLSKLNDPRKKIDELNTEFISDIKQMINS